MASVNVATQAELNAALAAGDFPILTGDGRFELRGDVRVAVEDSSTPHVVARGSSTPHVEARGSSTPHVEARGSSTPHVVARGSSTPHVVAWDSSTPHVEAWDSSTPHVEAWDSSTPHVVARDSSTPHVVARGSSTPHVVARDSSTPILRSSQPFRVTTDSSDVIVRHTPNITVEGGGLSVPFKPNRALFVAALAAIEAHPEQWDQSTWVRSTDCGTAYCMAGWVCQLSDVPLDVQAVSVVGGGDIGRAAAEKLRVFDEHGLFQAENSKDDLYRISAELLGDPDDSHLRSEVATALTVAPSFGSTE